MASTQRERADAARKVKLAEVQERVEDGSLTIRQMTPEERVRHPKPERPRPRRIPR